MLNLTTHDILYELNKYIIGQNQAKRAVAIALRNRWRRSQLSDELKKEITPKNILLVGPTGVGKTEIARRLSKITDSPFIKVAATKFTEVGYVGKEVDSIIRDLIDISFQIIKNKNLINNKSKAKQLAEERILDILLSNIKKDKDQIKESDDLCKIQSIINQHKQSLRQKLQDGELDDQIIEIQIYENYPLVELMSLPGMEDVNNQTGFILNNITSFLQFVHNEKRLIQKALKIKDAFKLLIEEESYKSLNIDKIKLEAIEQVEQYGIVFIDEIDKICKSTTTINNGDISGEGVQRDLLPLLEGCQVHTKYGLINTDHILFIAAGAFHNASTSDLIPELQGRFPIKVKLEALTIQDFVKILSSTRSSLIVQYQALLKTEEYNLIFTPDSILRMSEISWYINEHTNNIGARRLHTIIEKLLENLSFECNKGNSETITIDKNYVNEQLSSLIPNETTSKYII